MIKIFVDESGTHDDADVVTVAAYAGRPKTWQKWSGEWKKAKKPVGVFHAVEAANRTGEFEGWSRDKRDELVKRVLPVIASNSLAGAVIGLNKQNFEKPPREETICIRPSAILIRPAFIGWSSPC